MCEVNGIRKGKRSDSFSSLSEKLLYAHYHPPKKNQDEEVGDEV